MPLATGTRLGPYEMLALLGAGGMGEVYRARDSRLNRSVAIKVLLERPGARLKALQRFEREAQIVAGLNHTNICQVFDVGRQDDVEYLVMEYVDGETLAHRLKRGRLPPDQALQYAIQVADALDYAHRRGIIHRDLKPANVMVTKDGVKVLDFGLAIAREDEGALTTQSTELSASPTETLSLTGPGLVVGTLPYNSPEQLRGAEADARSDIFAFGAMLYEMATGHRAFRAKSQADLIVAVIQHEPPSVSASQPAIPLAIDRVVRRCLAKDPEDRWQTARDLVDELKWIADSGSAVQPVAPVQKPKWRAGLVLLAGLILVVALAAAGLWRAMRSVPPPSWTGALLGGPSVALDPRVSPDGQMLAMQAMVNGLTQVAVMKPESGNWMVLTKDRARGQVVEISWSRDGTKLYFDRNADVPRGIFSVAVLGGEERLVLEDAAFPEVLPDRSLLVAKINSDRKLQLHRFWPETGRLQSFPVELQSISGTPVRVFPDGKEAVFLGRPAGGPPETHLYALELGSGRTRRLAPDVSIGIVNNLFPLAVTPDGQSVLINLPSGNLHRIVAIPRNGGAGVRPMLTVTQIPWYLDVDAAGRLYLEQIDQPCEVLRFQAAGGAPERIAASPAFRFGAIAELPGAQVLVPAVLAGRARILVAGPGREPAPLVDTTEETTPPVTTVGGDTVAFLMGPPSDRAIAIAAVADGRIVRKLQVPQKPIDSLASSPDGKTLYYTASQTVWAVPAEGGEPRQLAAGDSAVAAPDGSSLLVKLNEQSGSRLVRVPAAGGPAEPIPFAGGMRLTALPLAAAAIGKDGRILVQVASVDSWFWRVAILDPSTGRTKRIPVDYDGDLFFSGWSADGRVMALGIGIKGGIWRFHAEP